MITFEWRRGSYLFFTIQWKPVKSGFIKAEIPTWLSKMGAMRGRFVWSWSSSPLVLLPSVEGVSVDFEKRFPMIINFNGKERENKRNVENFWKVVQITGGHWIPQSPIKLKRLGRQLPLLTPLPPSKMPMLYKLSDVYLLFTPVGSLRFKNLGLFPSKGGGSF